MIKVSVIGFGNIGKAVYEAISQAKDLILVSVVAPEEIEVNVPVLKNASEINGVDVAILCTPSRLTPDIAAVLLEKGISTVDSFDIHSSIVELRTRLDPIAKKHNCASIISAGWDPGSDSIIRVLMEAMLPKGITYTNFGPGMSMGHTVAVKAIQGVKNALSITIPIGTGLHRRMVYVELHENASFPVVEKAVKEDDYFIHDETHVLQVDSVDALQDTGHGVDIARKGVSGTTNNQHVDFHMSINNPSLTGQILVSSARAVVKQSAGCYTMIEIPPIDFLDGDPEFIIRKLV